MDKFILKRLGKITDLLIEVVSYGEGQIAAEETQQASMPSCQNTNVLELPYFYDFDIKDDGNVEVEEWLQEYLDKWGVANQKEQNNSMMPQYKDGSFRPKNKNTGLLEYRYRNIDNKIVSVYGFTKQDCWDKRTAKITQSQALNSPDKLTLTDWLSEWYKTYKAPYNGQASLKEINRYIGQITKHFGDKALLSAISALQCQQFINKYNSKPNTQNKIYDVLNSALDKSVQLGYIERNPATLLTLTPHKAKHYRALEYAEQQQVYEACVEPYKQLYYFLCCTGIRVGKALELTTNNIDWERKELKIIKKQRKGLTEEYRVAFLPSLFDNIKLPAKGVIFKISADNLRKYFSELYRKLGIKDATIHSFRHTFVSTLYALGVATKRIQALAGHATIDMTLNTYTHLLDKGTSVIKEYLAELAKLF